LSKLAIGSDAVVRAVDVGPVGEGRRLLEIGLVPGTPVRAARRAPWGGPTVYEFRSTRIALRREGADLIDVEVIEPAGVEVGS
jgi:Fe2+ transport system protein FeoA